MWQAAQERNKSMWVALKSRLTSNSASVGVSQRAGETRHRNEPGVDNIQPIRIQVMPAETARDDINSHDDTRDDNPINMPGSGKLSTFLTNHLEYMYFVGASATSVRAESQISGTARRMHKIAFYCGGAVSLLQGICDIKYQALEIARGGSIRDVADLCYAIARVFLRGTLIYKLSKDSETIRNLVQNLDSLGQPVMEKVGRKKIKGVGMAVIAFSFGRPVLFYLVGLGQASWNISEFLQDQFFFLLYDALGWSFGDVNNVTKTLEMFSNTAKNVGGTTAIFCNSVALIQELLASNIMLTSTITLDYMADSFHSELESATPLPQNTDEPKVGILPQGVWEKYLQLKKASGGINKKFGSLFNVLHMLFLLQCIYFVHTLLTKPKDANVPCDAIKLMLAGVMYVKMGDIAEVTDEFRDWIRDGYGHCTHLKVDGSSSPGITMAVLLDELRTKCIGIRGGVGVVTKAFMLVCASLAIDYFITLWENGGSCTCPELPNSNATALP